MSADRSGMWMWSRAVALLEEAERRHRHFFELLAAPANAPAWEPPVDLYIHEQVLHVLIALPGVRAQELSVELSPGGLWVRADTHQQVPPGARIRRLEIPYGRMERRIELPSGSRQLLGQELEHGCLHVRIAGEWL